MTQCEQERIDRLMPNGIPRWIRVWDSGSKKNNRYTVVYTGRYRQRGLSRHSCTKEWPLSRYVRMTSGIYQHGVSRTIIDCPSGFAEKMGRKCRHKPALGRRIRFQDLPDDCQKVVLNDYCDIWNIPEEVLTS